MSNFILKSETHSKIANLLCSAYECGFNHVGFSLSDKSKRVMGKILKHINCDHYSRIVYGKLFRMNMLAQADTYPHDNIDIAKEIKNMPDYPAAYWKIENGRLTDDVQAYKSIQCYMYNSYCSKTKNIPLMLVIKEIEQALAAKVISRSDAYGKAAWC
ncbi:MAG: hypothetical protein FWH03_05400 [Firmicutes bacterium]|nr:hypothetical protein [Bacillota bacterium]